MTSTALATDKELAVLTMPRPDAAELIADHLGQLPMPDGRSIRLMHFRNFAQSPDVQKHVAARGQLIGAAVVHLLEQNGYRVTHVNDPKPVEQSGRKVAKGICAHCGTQVLRLAVDDDMTVMLSAQALRAIQQMKPDCPHT